MLTLGVTGGIGAGKSVVCRMLETLGIPVYDTDREAKLLYDRDPSLKASMISLFGDELYNTPSGCIDRRRLAELIFSSSKALAQVEALVHPAVREDFARWREAIPQGTHGHSLCALESALLLSSPMLGAMVDRSLVVVAPSEVRITRAMNRDKVSREDILARMAKQLPQEQMMIEADYLIYNDNVKPLLPQLYHLLEELGEL